MIDCQGKSSGSINSFTALVVDDDPINLNLLCEMFGLRNWASQTASNGQSAVNFVRLTPYDLILMDLNMPVLDGRSALLQIRNQEDVRSIIVAMSAGISADDAEGLKQLGFDKVLVKPFTCQEVFKICEAEELKKREATS